MMDYGLNRHFIDSNPARMLKPKDFAATANRPRDRVLSLQELRKLWQALDEATIVQNTFSAHNTMSIVTTTAIKLLILTGARRGEVAGMKWEELSLEEGMWVLPSERTKNRQAHAVYLSRLAINLLTVLKAQTGKSSFVFDTGRKNEHSHIHEDTLTGVLLRLRGAKGAKKLSPLKDMRPFSVHDARRSAATAWGEYLKTDPHVIEKMLNHQPLNKLVATYQLAPYAEEQKAAWLKWGKLVEHQIARDPENIIPLKCTVKQ
jgi:integrase